jgi:hypothetical protein
MFDVSCFSTATWWILATYPNLTWRLATWGPTTSYGTPSELCRSVVITFRVAARGGGSGTRSESSHSRTCRSGPVGLFILVLMSQSMWFGSNSVAFSPQANCTDWAAAACQKISTKFWRGWRDVPWSAHRVPTAVNPSFLDQIHYFFNSSSSSVILRNDGSDRGHTDDILHSHRRENPKSYINSNYCEFPSRMIRTSDLAAQKHWTFSEKGI